MVIKASRLNTIQFSLVHAGRMVRMARKDAGLTQVQLATVAGVTQGRISQIENENGPPSIDVLVSLVAACGFRLSVTLVAS